MEISVIGGDHASMSTKAQSGLRIAALRGKGAAEGVSSKLKQRALREFRRFLVMFLYLWVLFAIFDLHRSIVLAEEHINYRAQGFAAINALMLAKVMLVAENFEFGERFKDRALILSVLYQAVIFTILFIAFHFAEKSLVGAFEGKRLSATFPNLKSEGFWVILSAGAVIFVALIPFFAFKDLSRAIGGEAMRSLMFSRGANRPQFSPSPPEDASSTKPAQFWSMSAKISGSIPEDMPFEGSFAVSVDDDAGLEARYDGAA